MAILAQADRAKRRQTLGPTVTQEKRPIRAGAPATH
jgi:hypothetical protein